MTGKPSTAWLKYLLILPGLKVSATRQPIVSVLVKPKGVQNVVIRIGIMASQRISNSILSIEIFGGFLSMTRDEAIAILEMVREDAIQIILTLAEKAQKYDHLCDKTNPTTPSGMMPVYLKPTSRRETDLLAEQMDIRVFPGNVRKK